MPFTVVVPIRTSTPVLFFMVRLRSSSLILATKSDDSVKKAVLYMMEPLSRSSTDTPERFRAVLCDGDPSL